MKHIPAWPKIRWGIDRNRWGLILRGDTQCGKLRLAADRCIDHMEVDAFRLPFGVWRHNTMRRIRIMIARYVEDRRAV